MERHARHAWVATPCILASLVLASPAPAADKPHKTFTAAAAVALSDTPRPPTPTLEAQAVAKVSPLDHVIIVVMENHSYTQTNTLPYISSLIKKYTSFSNSFAVAHPSEPNYLALWAASTLGLSDDSCPPSGSPYSAANLGQACEAAGLKWKSYCEDLPSVGSTACASSNNLYRRKHHPCPDFSNLTHSWEVPYSQFASDVAAGKLPALSFIVPNMCNDMHDCSGSTGDSWLATNVPAMISAVGPRGLVILTWDEDDKSSGNHILTVFAGPTVRPNYVSSTSIDHYTVVRTICDVLGLTPFANASSKATPTDIWIPGTTPVVSRTWGAVKIMYR